MSLFSIKNPSVNPAVELLDAMGAPARTFLFDVEFLLSDNFSASMKNFHWFVKSIDRPKYEFQYTEVNQYGFRHQILTGIRMGELRIEFIDDSTNSVVSWLRGVLDLYSPKINDRHKAPNQVPLMDRKGFDVASIRPMGRGAGEQVIKTIKIHQYAGINSDGTGRGKIRTWSFDHPQITSFDLDQQATENDAMSGLIVGFNFENAYLEGGVNEYPDRPDDPLRGVSDLTFAFNSSDGTLLGGLLGIAGVDKSLLEVGGGFGLGSLGGALLENAAGTIVTAGAGAFNSITDSLGPQNLTSKVQKFRNDSVPPVAVPDTSTVTAAVPTAAEQAEAVAKLPDLPPVIPT